MDQGIAEKLDALMPSIYIMLATLGALVILIIILTKFLYKPIKKMVEDRQKFIQKNIDDSVEIKDKMIQSHKESIQELEQAKITANEIISKSKTEAENIKSSYISEAKKEAKRIIDLANSDIARSKTILEQESRNEIIDIAVKISEKIIEKEVDENKVVDIIDNFLEKEQYDK